MATTTDTLTDTLNERRSGPGLLLALVGHAAMRRLRETHTEDDLSPRQLFLLQLLRDRGPTGQSELGAALDIDPSIVVTMLNPLEGHGWIVRERDPVDRRRHLVTLTAAGTRHLVEAAAAQRDAEDELLADLDEDERAELARLLTIVRARLGHEACAAAPATLASRCTAATATPATTGTDPT